MKIIFGTSNKRKIEDLENIINNLKLDIEVLSLSEIGWDQGEIDENGNSLEENSLIKAKRVFDFCRENNIEYPIITDDAGLFCDFLNGEPGIYTARYADYELSLNPKLPKYQCVIKLLNNLKDVSNRKASYKCCVTCMMPDGTYFQDFGQSNGYIAENIIGELKKPYFYSVFILEGYNKVFSELDEKELTNTYRYNTLKKILIKLDN